MMAKPKMETINDQKREERVAGFIEGLWDVRCHKLPVSYGPSKHTQHLSLIHI